MPAAVLPGEKQLDSLIREMRYKVAEYRRKEKKLEEREKRIQITQDLLKKQAKDLENLRVEVASLLPRLIEERTNLAKGRVLITQEEQANVKKLAPVFEKMEPAEGSKIMERMLKKPGDRVKHVVSVLVAMPKERSDGLLAAIGGTTAAMLAQEVDRIRLRAADLDNMDPADAGRIIERSVKKPKDHEDEYQDDQVKYVVSILVAMSERSSAKILEAMDDDLAAMLCEKVKKIREEG